MPRVPRLPSRGRSLGLDGPHLSPKSDRWTLPASGIELMDLVRMDGPVLSAEACTQVDGEEDEDAQCPVCRDCPREDDRWVKCDGCSSWYSLNLQPHTLNPKPYTLHPTLDPDPKPQEALNFQREPSAFISEPQTLKLEPWTRYHQICVLFNEQVNTQSNPQSNPQTPDPKP